MKEYFISFPLSPPPPRPPRPCTGLCQQQARRGQGHRVWQGECAFYLQLPPQQELPGLQGGGRSSRKVSFNRLSVLSPPSHHLFPMRRAPPFPPPPPPSPFISRAEVCRLTLGITVWFYAKDVTPFLRLDNSGGRGVCQSERSGSWAADQVGPQVLQPTGHLCISSATSYIY